MTVAWQPVQLGILLKKAEEVVWPVADARYTEVTVRLWGRGVVPRGVVDGLQLVGQRRFRARPGQFIASRIDARNGALGVVPASLDGAIVTNDFPLFDVDPARLEPEFLGWLSRTESFVELCRRASEGTTNRVRLKEERFLALEIALPPVDEQRRIVARIEAIAGKVEEARRLRGEADAEMKAVLSQAFRGIARDAPRKPMSQVAPLIRRPIEIVADGLYPELGIRSFGKGTFHKPALSGLEVGTKRLFGIESGDLLFSNVFAWEGAIAVARAEDAGRCGSHRFITCVPHPEAAKSEFLCFFFLTDEGLRLIGAASPGGAGRNRTLGLQALERIEVPIPSIQEQLWFCALLSKAHAQNIERAGSEAALGAAVPAVLDRAFRGEM